MTYSAENIRTRLYALQEPAYAAFSSKLIPGIEPPVGVRVPALRAFAKEIVKSGEAVEVLDAPVGTLFEERMLYGMVLGYAKLPVEQALRYCTKFVPHIDNWSVCDSTTTTFAFAKKNQDAVYDFLQPYLASTQEFEARFGIVMLLWHFINSTYIDRILDVFQNIRAEGYYAKMAVAWALSVCYIKFPAQTLPVFQRGNLDDFTHNKAIQKICESFRVSDEDKATLRTCRKARR